MMKSFSCLSDWFRAGWHKPLGSACGCAVEIIKELFVTDVPLPLVPGSFNSKLHRRVAVAIATQSELKEAFLYEAQMRREADLHTDKGLISEFPIHRLLPISVNQAPAFVRLRDNVLLSTPLRRAWSHWCSMESILLWIEVEFTTIPDFME